MAVLPKMHADLRACDLESVCMLQTDEAAAPMDTEAEMKQARVEQSDSPDKSSAAEDAPLVRSPFMLSHCRSRVWELSQHTPAAGRPDSVVKLRSSSSDCQDVVCLLQVAPKKVNEDLLQQLQEMGFSRNK